MAWARQKRKLTEAEIEEMLNLDEDDLHELVDLPSDSESDSDDDEQTPPTQRLYILG